MYGADCVQRKCREKPALVANHRSSYYETKQKVRHLWDELSAELPADLIAAAEARGRELDLWHSAETLLADKS